MKKFFINILCAFISNTKRRRNFRRRMLGRVSAPQATAVANNGPSVPARPEWLGRHSYYGINFVRMHPKSTIGAFCSFGHNVSVGPSQHPLDWLSSSPFQYVERLALVPGQRLYKYTNEPTFVGNDVWIGNNVTIKDGVKIADGCIIGSNAVVTHDTPPYAIVAGVPAHIIRYRFPPEIIEKLLILKWWDLPDEIIATLPFNDINKCLARLEKIRQEIPV